MVGLAAGLGLGGGVGVQVRPEGDAQAGALVGVAPPVLVVLVVLALAVPLAAEAAAQNGKVDAGGLGLFPVHLALVFGHVDALFDGGQNDLARVVEVKAVFVFGPGAGALPHIGHGGLLGAGVPVGDDDDDDGEHHGQGADGAQGDGPQAQSPGPAGAAGLGRASVGGRAAGRRGAAGIAGGTGPGSPGRGGAGGGVRVLPGPAVDEFAVVVHGEPLLIVLGRGAPGLRGCVQKEIYKI